MISFNTGLVLSSYLLITTTTPAYGERKRERRRRGKKMGKERKRERENGEICLIIAEEI